MPTTNRVRTTRPSHRAAAAFTLIESMVASVVLAFSVVAIASAVTASNRANEVVDGAAAALSVARTDMETLAAQPLDTLASPTGGTTQTIDLAAHAGSDADDARAASTATVTFVSRAALQGNRDIAVVKVATRSADGQVSTLFRVVTAEGNGQ